MAKNDIELSVGVKLDEAQLLSGYNSMLGDLQAATQKQIQSTVDETSGAAAKQWGPLPYYIMHNTSSGARSATKAFLPSLAQDLRQSGYAPDSIGYQSALVNAAYRSSMADPMQRYHRMLAMGMTEQADLTHPDTPIGKAIEIDYELMSQPWSRDFIRKSQTKPLDADILNKSNLKELRRQATLMGLSGLSKAKKADVISAMVSKSKESQLSFDFAGMREYAVEAGLGKWVNPLGENTAENFEFIDKELEKIDKKSEKTKKHFTGWGDSLKAALGTLTAIAAIGIKTFEVAYKGAEAGTVAAANEVDKRRGFLGMSSYDVLRTKVAGVSAGLGENAIYDEILGMSNKIERFKLEGKGDVLPEAIMGIFGTLVNASDPYGAYTKAIDQIYAQAKGMDTDERRRLLMLMSDAGLGSASSLVGAFLSNPDFAAQYGTPSQLFTLSDNPYYGVHNKAELLTPQIAKLNESLKASYEQMALDWEVAFGVPFKTWWNDTLKDTVVPWFESMITYISTGKRTGFLADRDYEKALNKAFEAQVKKNKNAAYEEVNVGRSDYTQLTLAEGYIKSAYRDKVDFLDWDYTGRRNFGDITAGESFLRTLDALGDEKNYVNPNAPGARAFLSRVALLQNFYKTTGFGLELGDKKATKADEELIQLGQKYLATGNSALLDAYLDKTFLGTEGWQEILSFVKEYKGYLMSHPDALTELHVRLFNNYGEEIHSEVTKAVYGDAGRE